MAALSNGGAAATASGASPDIAAALIKALGAAPDADRPRPSERRRSAPRGETALRLPQPDKEEIAALRQSADARLQSLDSQRS